MVDPEPALPQAALDSMERNALMNASRHGGRADMGAVMSKVLGEFPEIRSKASEVAKELKNVVESVNSLSASDQAALLERKYPGAEAPKGKEGRVGLPPLPDAVKGKVVVRLPPEPSGFMHIGHAMAFTVNYLYKEEYDGKLWLRFEDTNPRKASRRYYDSFRRGISWLGITWDFEKNVSEDTELIYGYGKRLLDEGKAYACECDEATVKKLRFDGTVCQHRSRPPEENLAAWEEMLSGKFAEGSIVIRLKGEMGNPDYSLRDPNLFRVIDHDHVVTGKRYRVWPTYDLANTVEDEICGVTHVLRSAEFHTSLQQKVREMLGFRKVDVIQFSRYNFKGTPVQKRLLRPLVESGMVSGWDDPRMPTVDGIRRRGILPETIRQFTLQVGYTRTEHEYDWSLLFAVNRKLLDPVTKRVFFVPNPVRLAVRGAASRRVVAKFHPDADLGARTLEAGDEFFVPADDISSLELGSVFRLLDLYNVELTSGGANPTAKFVGEALIQGTRKLQWVTPAHEEIKVLVPGLLFDEKGEYNKDSLLEVRGFAEPSASSLKEGDIVQFPRFGFCRKDSPGTFIMAHK